ncbi:related to CYC8 General repressor of transcription [Cephalotrichum gorgonifer]|uniref:Related to CYC8 General repressor of transcription n=1 Tax=Cephalotrichum gorgonifer TaxID=2041049 RepID=A0AAE8SYS3_9PEZI|nr:related to CYC8 General repressor of transcription [Cephalotrichum gorgonifer]
MRPERHQRAPGSFSPLSADATQAPSRQPPPIPLPILSMNASSPIDEHPNPIPSPARGDNATRHLTPNKPTLRTHLSTSASAANTAASTAAAAASGKPPSSISTHPAFLGMNTSASHSNSNNANLQNFSRPSLLSSTSTATNAGTRPSPSSAATTQSDTFQPLFVPAPATRSTSSETSLSPRSRTAHHRKHSAQGHFEPTLPSTSSSNLSHPGMMAQAGSPGAAPPPGGALSASQIAAQAAVLTHQQSGAPPSQNQNNSRQRSQTIPPSTNPEPPEAQKRKGSAASNSRAPLSPPIVSLTEASVPRDTGFSNQGYRNGLMGSHSAAATTAANVVFSRSGPSSPNQPSHPQMPPPPVPEKPSKPEKSKGRLFSRPRKISTRGETDEKPLPSPGKIGSALSVLQRGNFSTTSLTAGGADSSASSIYSMANSSTATIRPIDTVSAAAEAREGGKEKKHHFLSRQKHKLKEEYHLASASSSSKAPDSHGLSSLYSLNLPPSSPASNSTSFPKSIGGLDLRHGVRRDKRRDEQQRSESRMDNESIFDSGGTGHLGSYPSNAAFLETLDPGKYGLNAAMSYDDAWPFLKAKLLVVFEGEDLRLPVEDFNRVVLVHIQYCISRRSPNIILDDVRDLLHTGFSSLDLALRKTPEDRVIPALVELWLFTFTSILPYMQAVLLPLDLEFAGCGTLLTPEKARDFWGGVLEGGGPGRAGPHVAPASSVIDVRRLVLNAYRDIVILPRYETLRTIFSRLSLEFLPSSFASMALASPPFEPTGLSMSTSPSESFMSLNRPGTAMSIDPSLSSSYNSSSTTLLGGDQGRNRATSNVSYGSGGGASTSDGGFARPFTPSSLQALGEAPGSRGREQNVEDSKQVAELAGRMLQCMSVLASVGSSAPPAGADAESAGGGRGGGMEGWEAGEDIEMSGDEKMEELCRLLKLNWLGRGRTGRNRRGMVGGRVRRGQNQRQGEVRVA